MKRFAPYRIGVAFLFVLSTASAQKGVLSIPGDLRTVPPVFEYLTRENGLPENSVKCILQDHLGYLWLGTQNGLVRYDGYVMKVYQAKENTFGFLSNNVITTIYEDKGNTLWVGTVHGLNKFDRASGTFTSYIYNPKDRNSINGSNVRCICEDRYGRLWIGTPWGLSLADREKGTFAQFYLPQGDSLVYRTDKPGTRFLAIRAIIEDPTSSNLLVGTQSPGLWEVNIEKRTFSKYRQRGNIEPDNLIGPIVSFCKARDGRMWIASSHSLSCLDPERRNLTSCLQIPILPGANSGAAGVVEAQDGYIWCGFFAGDQGIFRFDPKMNTYLGFRPYPKAPEGSRYNQVNTVYQDRSGILWAGVWEGGAAKWNPRSHAFRILENKPGNPNSIADPLVSCMAYDSSGYLWVGTRAGLDKYDLTNGTFEHYFKRSRSDADFIYRSVMDASGNLWIGTRRRGLMLFNPRNATYKRFFDTPQAQINLAGKIVGDMIFDHLGILWISVEGNGIYRFDPRKNTVTHFASDRNERSSLSGNQIITMYEDHSGTMWFGTRFNGLNKFDRSTGKFTRCKLQNGRETIMGLHEDRFGNFWVAEYFTGINLYDREKDSVIAHYNHSDGLACDAIEAILEDHHNNLWLCTENGLSRFSILARSFKNFSKADGLPDNWFRRAHYVASDGTMFLSTEAGVIIFHPDSLQDDPVPPQVVLQNVSLFNRPGERLDYRGFVSEIKEITVPYHQNDLRFDFVGLHFSYPAQNRYRYYLENFDKDWVDAGTQRSAPYTNLDPGKYVFHVNASNRDGVWSEQGASITIIITPPWWETPFAYFIYALLLVSTAYFTWKLQLRRIRTKQALEMTRFEAEKLHEVDEMKSRFFANISHEFRTPLTLILGPVQQMAEQTEDEKTRENLGIVHRNARRLLSLVNQLLDFAKLESGAMKLHAVPRNVIPILRGIVLSFGPHAERKKTTLKFSTPEDEIVAYIDKEKFERIVTNILSNAFKFTPEGGAIELHVTNDANAMVIQISDTGIGIPQEKIPRVFDRFYQVNNGHTREQEGTGIGLALTKELVELHKGSISVESEEGKGSVFSVRIPLGTGHLNAEDISESSEVEVQEPGTAPELLPSDDVIVAPPEIGIVASNGKPILLVVEDNADVRTYIEGIVEAEYELFEASDGEIGWLKATEHLPDIIVSDIMMPKMDGFTLCEKLKTDERTSHIPVILLTAKAASQDKIHGFETGADEYITKPFEPEELKARIKNLLAQRQRLHQHFQKHGFPGFDNSKLISIDKKFLQKVFHIITDNIGSPSFNVESLAEMAAVSRSVLRRKIVSLTGEPPVELIRRVRLSRAAELIEKNYGNMSEIALEVGFTNPSYFSECFRKQYGVAPSNYPRK